MKSTTRNQRHMKKLIVFDWNGTLLSDTLACVDSVNQVFKTFGRQPINIRTYRKTVDIPSTVFYLQHGFSPKELKKNAKKIAKIFHDYYEPRAAKCRSRAGARELLRWLSQQKIKTIILSNHTVVGVQNQLKRLGIKQYITEIIANTLIHSTMKGRNKEEKLKYYLKTHKYKLKDVLIVGDTPEETQIGKALDIGTVSITDGFCSTRRLKAAKPDFLIHRLDELKKIIKNSL
jgi:phosphoglycolate phosphatase